MGNIQDKKYKVLVIEDNELNCGILCEMLREQYDMLFAHDGEEGMNALREHYSDIDVVLLDIQMPVMNGYEVLEAKGKEALLKDIPVIVTTSSNGSDEEVKCLELGAQDFVRKPYDPFVVRLRIESIINLRESTEANRQKALFIQNISHEIRTPMNAIMGFTQLMESMIGSMQDEEMKLFCDNILNNSYELMGMIDNMVALSSFDSGNMHLKIVSVSPNQICQQAMEAAAYCAPEGVKVYLTSDVDDSYRISSDAKYLQQAIFNYIINASKFTKQGEIHIHCALSTGNEVAQTSDITTPVAGQTSPLTFLSPDNGGTEGGKKTIGGLGGLGLGLGLFISVTDTGISVPSDKADFIFDRFTKIDAFVPGMGLGLAITRKIASALNGTAYLDTSYTGGSRFVLELPCQDNH